MADAVDGEGREVGAADQPRQQGAVVVDPAVVMQEPAAETLDGGSRLPDLLRTAADIEQGEAAKLGGRRLCLALGRLAGCYGPLQSLDLPAQQGFCAAAAMLRLCAAESSSWQR